MKNATHISIVLDRSGSMSSIANDIVGGLNRFIADQQKVPGDCTFTLVQFDTQGVDTLYSAKPIAEVKPITDYQPRGGTPLYDAIGDALTSTGEHLKALAEDQRPDKVIFVIITDGEENSSHRYTHEQIRSMIKLQTDTYKWQFVFLGANIDSYAVGQSMGVSAANVMNFAGNERSVVAMCASLSDNTALYRTARASNMAYSAQDRKAQEDAGASQTH